MSRILDDVLLDSLNSGNSKLVILVRMKIRSSGGYDYIRLNSSSLNIQWDESGVGREEYLGIGNYGTINSAEEGTELQSYSIDLTISGIPPEYVVDALDLEYKNLPMWIYLAPIKFNHNIGYTTNEEDGPTLLFVGRMDTMNMAFSDTATITVTANSRLSDWERSRGGKYNHHTQKGYYAFLHEGAPSDVLTNFANQDLGFEYVDSLKDREVNWGGDAATLGQEGTGVVPSGGGRTRPSRGRTTTREN